MCVCVCVCVFVCRFLGYYAYGNAVKAPITLNLPEDGLSIFTNVCLDAVSLMT